MRRGGHAMVYTCLHECVCAFILQVHSNRTMDSIIFVHWLSITCSKTVFIYDYIVRSFVRSLDLLLQLYFSPKLSASYYSIYLCCFTVCMFFLFSSENSRRCLIFFSYNFCPFKMNRFCGVDEKFALAKNNIILLLFMVSLEILPLSICCAALYITN